MAYTPPVYNVQPSCLWPSPTSTSQFLKRWRWTSEWRLRSMPQR